MHFQTFLTRLAAASVLAFAAVGAHADTYDFSLTSGGQTLTWQMASSPTPDYVASSQSFKVENLAFSPSGLGTAYFFSDVWGGGLMISDEIGDYLYYRGVQLYSGTESTPSFTPGSYELNTVSTYWPNFTDAAEVGTLTISAAPVAAVPEPATWALTMAGLGVVGALHRRRRSAAAAPA